MSGRAPRRRWLRRAFVALAILLALLAFGAWRFTGDRDRVVGFLAAQARDALGVELVARGDARVSWWPTPGVRLGDVVVTDPSGAPLLSAATLGARVPWTVLWSRELHLAALEADGARIETAGLTRLAAARRADGPPSPLRWPKLDAALVLRDAIVVLDDGRELRVALALDPIAVDAPIELEATIDDDGAAPLAIALAGIAREAADGIGVDEARVSLSRRGEAAPVAFRGRLAFAAASDWRAEGMVESGALPPWLAGSLPGAAGAPLQLEVAIARDSGPLAIRARGTLAGATLDADFAGVAPPGSTGFAGALALLASPALRGSASVDRVAIGDVVFEGVRVEAGPADPP